MQVRLNQAGSPARGLELCADVRLPACCKHRGIFGDIAKQKHGWNSTDDPDLRPTGQSVFFQQVARKQINHRCPNEGEQGMIRERGGEIEPDCREEGARQPAARTISSRQQMDRATIEAYEKKRRGKKCGVHKTVNSHSSLHCCGCSCIFPVML